MQTFKTLPDAIALAEFAHRSQVDKAGLPYIEHPRRVLAKVQAMGALPYVQIAAILHDVTEDTKFTGNMLLQLGFSEAAVQVIDLLDRNTSQRLWAVEYGFERIGDAPRPTADEYYYQKIAADPGAKTVKRADIEDNLSPWRLAYLTKETQERLQIKYALALDKLA